MEMKVLEVSAKLNIGGAQLVAANIAKYAPEDDRFCYIVYGDSVGEYEQEILARGNSVLHMPSPQDGSLRYLRSLIRLMKQERFDAVHSHTMYSSGLVMLAAWLARVPGRLCHSHTAKDDARQSFRRSVYKALMRFLMRRFSTDWLACGVSAGRELYGRKWFDRHGVVIPNGIDFASYRYREEAARAVRQRYHLENAFVIGHVGHYVRVKNQRFLIALMPELLKKRPNAVLLMFGEGEDRAALSEQIRALGLETHACLMGNVHNIPEVLSAFDLFAFPSLFEGTPIALIEAQANGLPCLVSDRVPEDACRTNLIKRLPLDDPELWLNAIASSARDVNTAAPAELAAAYDTVQQSMERIYHLFRSYAHKRTGE